MFIFDFNIEFWRLVKAIGGDLGAQRIPKRNSEMHALRLLLAGITSLAIDSEGTFFIWGSFHQMVQEIFGGFQLCGIIFV